MSKYKDVMKKWKAWRFDEPMTENTTTFTKDEMKKMHKDGKVVKTYPDGKEHTYVYNENT
jgi:hypothetical protein